MVVVYYLADQIQDVLLEHEKKGYITFINAGKFFKTATYLKEIKQYLEDPFMVVNGDTLTNLDLNDFIEFHLTNRNIATVFTKHDAIRTGGSYVFDKEVLKYIKPDMDIPDLMQFLIDQNIPINIYRSEARYFDIGTEDKLKLARKFYEKT